MSLKKILSNGAIAIMLVVCASSCKDKKSYADLLTDEYHAVNYFLAQQEVENEIPADTVFKTGPDAPFYRLDAEGNLYMQVINPGTKTNKVKNDELIYFRYARYNLLAYMADGAWTPEGNSVNVGQGPTSFRYDNYTLPSSSTYGAGVQAPLRYLGVDCEVNLVIKSQYGLSEEIAAVTPYMYNLRYFRSPL